MNLANKILSLIDNKNIKKVDDIFCMYKSENDHYFIYNEVITSSLLSKIYKDLQSGYMATPF